VNAWGEAPTTVRRDRLGWRWWCRECGAGSATIAMPHPDAVREALAHLKARHA